MASLPHAWRYGVTERAGGPNDSIVTAGTVVEIKLAFKLVKATGQGSTVHGKFPIVLDFPVTTTSTNTFASKEH